MNILINIIAIQDSGGITVLYKLLDEIKDSNLYVIRISKKMLPENLITMIIKKKK